MRRQHSIVVFLRLELPIDDRERERGEGGRRRLSFIQTGCMNSLTMPCCLCNVTIIYHMVMQMNSKTSEGDIKELELEKISAVGFTSVAKAVYPC